MNVKSLDELDLNGAVEIFKKTKLYKEKFSQQQERFNFRLEKSYLTSFLYINEEKK
jgi:hypothetical protein